MDRDDTNENSVKLRCITATADVRVAASRPLSITDNSSDLSAQSNRTPKGEAATTKKGPSAQTTARTPSGPRPVIFATTVLTGVAVAALGISRPTQDEDVAGGIEVMKLEAVEPTAARLPAERIPPTSASPMVSAQDGTGPTVSVSPVPRPGLTLKVASAAPSPAPRPVQAQSRNAAPLRSGMALLDDVLVDAIAALRTPGAPLPTAAESAILGLVSSLGEDSRSEVEIATMLERAAAAGALYIPAKYLAEEGRVNAAAILADLARQP